MTTSGNSRGPIKLFALVLVGGMGIAAAQTQAPATTQPSVELSAGRDVTLTVPEMVANSKAFLPAMDRGAAIVRRQLADAREKRDVVRVLCLNDKLNQIDLAVRTTNDRMEALNAAASVNDLDRTKHEFTVVQVLRDRVNTLVSEANQCLGEETGFVGDSKVTVDVDPGVADTDPSDFPNDPLVNIVVIVTDDTIVSPTS